MFKKGDLIDNKYEVLDTCSDSGGMGTILFVKSKIKKYSFRLVLKYCKELDNNYIKRFKREVRYLNNFKGNSKVIQLIDSNLKYAPPYFIMKYYQDGDLSKIQVNIQNDSEYQEVVFTKMIDCISELHYKNYQHRDIKPQNFLIEYDSIIVTDLGLCKEVGAGTTFTVSNEFWGTQIYMPPEFQSGNFKDATPSSDIFMLGKSFYNLLTGRDPLYITDDDIHPAIYHIIEKCCHTRKENRYKSLTELKQNLILAYDVILGRAKGGTKALQKLNQILDRLNSENKYDVKEINEFIDLLVVIDDSEKYPIIRDIPNKLYLVLAQDKFNERLETFLNFYGEFVREEVQDFAYAETVAKNMKTVFYKSKVNKLKAKSLEHAINGSIWANRFAAMDICIEMLCSIKDNTLGILVASIILKNKDSFLSNIEIVEAKCLPIRNALTGIKE